MTDEGIVYCKEMFQELLIKALEKPKILLEDDDVGAADDGHASEAAAAGRDGEDEEEGGSDDDGMQDCLLALVRDPFPCSLFVVCFLPSSYLTPLAVLSLCYSILGFLMRVCSFASWLAMPTEDVDWGDDEHIFDWNLVTGGQPDGMLALKSCMVFCFTKSRTPRPHYSWYAYPTPLQLICISVALAHLTLG